MNFMAKPEEPAEHDLKHALEAKAVLSPAPAPATLTDKLISVVNEGLYSYEEVDEAIRMFKAYLKAGRERDREAAAKDLVTAKDVLSKCTYHLAVIDTL